MMAIFHRASLLFALLLRPLAFGLQVTPNSPCALTCMDDPTQDVSDPNSSNTYPDDIVCADADFANTAIGRKYESCVDCLRNSTATGDGESDQSWFIYNIRYALNSCLFGFKNVSDAQSTPCSTESSCGPIQQALEDGNLNPDNETTYGYCSADNNVLLGSSLAVCTRCLQDVTTETYLANFLIVLQAGCVEQPVVGVNLGIRGNIFSSSPINITFPGDDPYTSTSSKKKRLSEGAIIGMVAGIAVLAVLISAVSFICYRKMHNTRSMRRLTSSLDSRFGSKNISPPNSGTYGNTYTRPPTEASDQFDTSVLSQKELKALGLHIPNVANSRVPLEEDGTWQDAHAHFEATQNQLPTYTSLPVHQAYIPDNHEAVSPATGLDTNNIFRMSSIPSSRSSPNVPPPPAVTATVLSAPVARHATASVPAGPRRGTKAIPPPVKVPQPRSHNVLQQVVIPPARPTPIPEHPRVTIPEHPRQIPAPARQQEETFQVARPGLHSQQAAVKNQVTYPAMAETRPPSRTNSIAPSWTRARSSSRTGRNRSTSRNGRDRSTSRNALRDSWGTMDVPTRISGPMIHHGGRFDVDFNEEERRVNGEREASHKKADATPSSAESQEQWPGSY